MTRVRRAAWAVLLLAAAALVGLGVRQYGLRVVRVAGTSMSPTLLDGDLLLVTGFDYEGGRGPGRGAVIQCRFAERDSTYIKRVVGLPGEAVEAVDGRVLVDGATLEEPYLTVPTEAFSAVLGAGEYLVLGDNRAESYDSRMADMGPVRSEDCLGRVRWILWPPGRMGRVE